MAGARRGHGEDSIYFDQANGYWVAAVSLGYSPDGKRRRRTVRGRTKTEARDKLRVLHEEIAANVQAPAAYTVAHAVDDWLADGLDGRSEETVAKYRHVLKPVLAEDRSGCPARSDGSRRPAGPDGASAATVELDGRNRA
jgi:hypothetical protein